LAQIRDSFERQAPLKLMFQDEARFGRITDCRRCWCRHPVRPLVRKMISRQYTCVFGAVSPLDGQFDTLMLPQVNTAWMQVFLDEVARRHQDQNIVMVLDGAGWHTAHDLAVPANMRLLPLPPYSPELNPVEHLWDELREKSFHNRIFDSMDALEQHLCETLQTFEQDTARIRSICAWPWIVNSVCNEN
jgi:transposase